MIGPRDGHFKPLPVLLELPFVGTLVSGPAPAYTRMGNEVAGMQWRSSPREVAGFTRSKSCCPPSVSDTVRVVLCRRRTPTRSSSDRTSWLSADYAASVGTIVTALRQSDGRQIGDPERGAQGILDIVDSNTPPLHLLLGSDALRRAREKLDHLIDEMDQRERVTHSTDFP